VGLPSKKGRPKQEKYSLNNLPILPIFSTIYPLPFINRKLNLLYKPILRREKMAEKKQQEVRVEDQVRALIAQIESVRAEITALDTAIGALRQTVATLRTLKRLGAGKNVLIPVGSIAQVEMKIENMDRVIVSVGQNISAELSYDEAVKYIEDEIERLLALRLVLEQTIADLYTQIDNLVKGEQQEEKKEEK
jgi:prefoldin alpha subunit